MLPTQVPKVLSRVLLPDQCFVDARQRHAPGSVGQLWLDGLWWATRNGICNACRPSSQLRAFGVSLTSEIHEYIVALGSPDKLVIMCIPIQLFILLLDR